MTTGRGRSRPAAPRTSPSASTAAATTCGACTGAAAPATGELMVRREEQPWQSRATLFLDNRLEAHRGHGAASSLEYAVSAAASIALHLSQRGFMVRLVTADGEDRNTLWHDRAVVPEHRSPARGARGGRHAAKRRTFETRLARRGRAHRPAGRGARRPRHPRPPGPDPAPAPRRHPARDRARRRRLARPGRPRLRRRLGHVPRPRSAGGPSGSGPPTGCRRCGRSSAAGPAASWTRAPSTRCR